jgi:tetratricopeptide (TPR) repeat protein
MPIKGSLQEAGLAEVCQLLSMGQKTGCLSVTDRSRFGQIFFDRGRITFATIINRPDRLGDLLLRGGAITLAQLKEAVAAQADAPDRRLGQLLVDLGYVEEDTLGRYIVRQIHEAVYHLFTWNRGSFYFEGGKTPGSGEILISASSESLLLEGARRVDEWSVIESLIPSLDLVFAPDRAPGEREELTPDQQDVLPLLDGQRTVKDVAAVGGISEFDTAKALYRLVRAGLARQVGRRERDESAEPTDPREARKLGVAFYETAMLEDAEREFRGVLDGDPDDVTARHYVALIALRRHEPEEAVKRLQTLLENAGPRVGGYLNLAYALRLEGRHDHALNVLAEAEKLAPGDVRVRLAQGATELCAGNTETAAMALANYRAMLPEGTRPAAPYFYCAALAAAVEERTKVAEALVREGIEAYPASAPLHLLAGNVAERRADTVEAERCYQRAAEEDVTLAQAHRNLGDLAYRRGIQDEALEHYRRAVEADPWLGDELYTRLGDLYYRRSERDEAVRCWERAVEMNPHNEVARNHLEVIARAMD